jgi:hypothetical protein
MTGVQAYVLAQNQTTPVLALVHDVGWGHSLGDGDLAVAAMVPDEHLQASAADDRAGVVGQIAAHTLSAGTLLTRGELTTLRVPSGGQIVVGVLLKPGGLPAKGVRPEDRVLLTPASTGSSTSSEVAPVSGIVLDSGSPNTDGSVVVDVVVDRASGAIAGPAGAGQVVVSLLAPSGR